MTNRTHPRELDPLGGVVGDGIVIGPDGQFTVGPVGSGGGGGGFAGGLQTMIELYGPEPKGSNALSQASTGGYVWPGDALTSSTATLHFEQGLPDIAFARWLLVWVPRATANGMRLMHFDDGPTNLTQFAEITGRSESTPVVSTVDVTAALQALAASAGGSVHKHVGNQITAGATAPTIHLSRLEIVWASASGGGAAAGVTVDDSGFTHILGTDVQAALASIDSQLGSGGAAATTALVPLTTVVGGVPELVWEADNSLAFTEVPL